MAARITISHPELDEFEWLHQTSDAIIACRGQGHNWPKLRNGKPPKGLRHRRYSNGSVRLEFICRDCGTVRRIVTLPTGEISLPAHYTYEYPQGYKAPKGVSRRQCFIESGRRWLEDFREVLESLPVEGDTAADDALNALRDKLAGE